MKNMNMKERYWTMNLQLFAGDGGDDNPGEEGRDDDDEPGELPFYLVTFVNEGDEDDMLAPSWELDPEEWEQLVDEERFMRVEQPS